MDLSEHYGEIDIGVKASHENDFAHLPVGSYVTRDHLETVQESFWDARLTSSREI
ncbi:hypothetical protein HCTV-16_gp167 [Haloarcula virus HCTV-16]|nr:hypothetical protein HCTV-16_gp167 [Haloarcula virus HCTV-16]